MSNRRQQTPISPRACTIGRSPKAQIEDYWIVNLVEDIVEVYHVPQPDAQAEAGYACAEKSMFRRGDVLTPHALSQARIAVSDLLP